jgi:hypothetical protein
MVKPCQDQTQCLLKNCTARSCFCAAASDEKVPKFLRFPVFASFFREYNRYSPDLSLRIMCEEDAAAGAWVGQNYATKYFAAG